MKEITVTTDDLMSVQEAAGTLKLHRFQLYRWIARGKVIGIKLGGILFVPKSEVERLQKEHTNAETARLAGGFQKGAR